MFSDDKPAYYIKLGKKSKWHAECVADGVIRLGYETTPYQLCVSGDWEGVAEYWWLQKGKKDFGSAKRHAIQVRAFFEAESDQIFCTFHDRQLWWCRPTGRVQVCDDGTHLRRTVDGWHNRSHRGALLTMDRLSGKLLRTEGFRGTICEVEARKYLIEKLTDTLSPELVEVERAEGALSDAILALIRHLSWRDFEVLVDLLFATSGWRRIGDLGRTQKNHRCRHALTYHWRAGIHPN